MNEILVPEFFLIYRGSISGPRDQKGTTVNYVKRCGVFELKIMFY